MLRRFRFLAVVLLLIPSVCAFAQGLSGLIKSPPVPATYVMSKLPEDFVAVELKATGDTNSFPDWMLPMSMGMSAGGEAQQAAMFIDSLRVCWTNGQFINTEIGDFLVTYRVDLKGIGDMTKPDPVLHLNLVRKDAILQISPRPDVKRDSLFASPFEGPMTTTAPPSPNAAKSAEMSNLKQSALGMLMYCGDYDDYTPYVQDTRSAFAVIMPYCKNTQIFKSVNPNGGRILMNMAIAGVSMTAIESPADTVLFYDSIAWPDGTRLVAFVDGHVKSLDPEEWRRVSSTLNLKFKRYGKPLPAGLDKKLYPGQDIG